MFISTPCPASQPRSSTCATTGQPNFCASATVSPTWSPWPWVSEDRVDPLGLLLGLRALRVAVQERVDVDALAARGVDAERRVPEPGECRWPCAGAHPEDRPVRRRTSTHDHAPRLRLARRRRRARRRSRQHSLAYYALVVAVPVVALAALSALGDVLDGTAAEPHDRAGGALTALALPLVLLGAAVRAPLLAEGRRRRSASRPSSSASRSSRCRRCSLRRRPSRASVSRAAFRAKLTDC